MQHFSRILHRIIYFKLPIILSNYVSSLKRLFVIFCYSTKLGMYEENCGLSNVLMSWGHDGQHHLNLLFVVVPAIILVNTVQL